MSTVDTLVGVLIGLVGAVPVAVVVHLLDERAERNRLRRETALGPRQQKQTELTDAFHAMVDLGLSLSEPSKDPSNLAKIKEALGRYDPAFMRGALWVSPKNYDTLT